MKRGDNKMLDFVSDIGPVVEIEMLHIEALANEKRIPKAIAKILWDTYVELVDVGFTCEQAMEIIKNYKLNV